jgi:spermidine/putrescine ABC transporter ATP-binding subunit
MRLTDDHIGAGATMAALQLEGVVKRYAAGVEIGPVSFEANRGDFVSLLGPSGCGKTTLLRTIAGFETVTSGAILLNGVDVAGLPAHKRNVGLVFQNYSLFPHLSAFENVAFGLRLRRLSADEIAKRVAAALAAVELSGVDDRLPAQLSGGQQQRVAIARSMVLEPSILLLDEPLSNLDLKLREQMRQELRSLQRRLNTTFVYVTHDQTEALAMSDRIVVMSRGKMVQMGTPQEIYDRPVSRFVADFIGGANLVHATVVAGGDTPLARVGQGAPFPFVAHRPVVADEKVWIAIRPESIAPGTAQASHFNGTVTSSTFLGDRTQMDVQLTDGPVLRSYGPKPLEHGTHVSLQVSGATSAVSVGE